MTLLLVAPPTLGSYGLDRASWVDLRAGAPAFTPIPMVDGPIDMSLRGDAVAMRVGCRQLHEVWRSDLYGDADGYRSTADRPPAAFGRGCEMLVIMLLPVDLDVIVSQPHLS